MSKTKLCKTCDTTKNLGEFANDKSKKDGVTTQCKACKRAYRAANKEHLAEINKKYKQTPEGRYRTYRDSAKSRGFQWKLTSEEFMKFWRKACSYCGGDIGTIGLDRIDPSLPYQTGNIEPCCKHCNRMKSDLTRDSFVSHIEKVYKFVTGGSDD